MEVQGKNFLIVGGSSGIGREIVRKLQAKGANVWNASRTPSGLAGVTDLAVDVSDESSQLVGLPEVLHGLVYSPGSIHLKPFQSLKPADFLRDFELNVLGAVKVTQSVLKPLKASGNASVVYFSTVAVTQGMSFHASVAASKGAIEGLTRSLAAEFSRQGIRFNAIAPSLTDTPLAQSLLSTPEKKKASEDRHPLRRIGHAAEIADGAVYLLSESAAWITGQVLNIDGGLSSVRPI